MSLFINYNGKLLPEGTPIITGNNRGLRYGDGLFETMRLQHGEIRLFDLHMDRLFKGLELLKFDIPALFTKEFISESILQLSHKNKLEQLARVRLNVFRGAGGLYDPENLHPNYIIEVMPLPDHYLHLNENGLVVDIYPDARKTCDLFSNSKTNNYLPYVMAALHAKQNKLNDCLVLNQHDRICDATIANIFWIKDSVIYTPPLSEGCVAGVMRRYLMQKLLDTVLTHHSFSEGAGIAHRSFSEGGILETPLNVEELEKAQEVFLTNASYGIRWVKQFRNTTYTNSFTQKIYNEFL